MQSSFFEEDIIIASAERKYIIYCKFYLNSTLILIFLRDWKAKRKSYAFILTAYADALNFSPSEESVFSTTGVSLKVLSRSNHFALCFNFDVIRNRKLQTKKMATPSLKYAIKAIIARRCKSARLNSRWLY